MRLPKPETSMRMAGVCATSRDSLRGAVIAFAADGAVLSPTTCGRAATAAVSPLRLCRHCGCVATNTTCPLLSLPLRPLRSPLPHEIFPAGVARPPPLQLYKIDPEVFDVWMKLLQQRLVNVCKKTEFPGSTCGGCSCEASSEHRMWSR